MVITKSPSILHFFRQKIASVIVRIRAVEDPRKDNVFWQYMNSRQTDSMESLANYVEKNMAQFEDTNPGPLFPLSEYGNTCFMRGCEELHVECADKTHYIVEHCNCSPSNPDMAHRHIFEYCDLLEPPTTGRVKQADIGHFDVDVLRRLLIISHPHYSTLSRTATHRSSIVATSVNEDSNGSSEDSFEIQIRTTTPDVDLLSNTFFKNRRESQDARDMLSQQNGRPVWWNSRSGDL